MGVRNRVSSQTLDEKPKLSEKPGFFGLTHGVGAQYRSDRMPLGRGTTGDRNLLLCRRQSVLVKLQTDARSPCKQLIKYIFNIRN